MGKTVKKILAGLLLLSTSVFAADTDGFNPQIFEAHKWSSYDICSEAMFMMTINIRNEYNIKVVQRNEKRTVWNIYVGKTIELTCRADGYYTAYFKDNMPRGTYTTPHKFYTTPDISIPQNFQVL